MKIKGKIYKVQGTHIAVKTESERWKVGDVVTVHKGAKRSLSQNALYWVFLTWLINEGGLKQHGHFLPQSLHDNFKAYLLSEKKMSKGQFVAIEESTTTNLNKIEFGEYFEKVNVLVFEIFNVDTAPFWDIHKEEYGGY